MKLVYDELIPVLLDKAKSETDFIDYQAGRKATITGSAGIKLKYQLKDRITSNITSFIPLQEHEVIDLMAAGLIRFAYNPLSEDKQISLLLFKE